jgi:DNA-binding transcriptional MocR family regulator
MASLLDKVELVTKLAADKRLTDAQFRAAVTLLLKFHNSANGACHPSLRQWADASTLGRSTVSEAASRLRDIGVIGFEASSGGRNRRNSYTVNVRPAEQKRSPSRNALNTRYKYNRGERKTGTFSQPQFKPEKQINIPPPEVRAAQVAARLGGFGLGVR